MSRPQFFIITSTVIFMLERVLPSLTSWPIFIFPVFIIIFLLTSKNDTSELLYVAASSLIFDFFSGLHFGFFTVAILAVVFAIFIFKTRFNIDPQSLFSLAIYALVFTLAYFAIISIKSNPRFSIDQVYIAVVEIVPIFIIFNLIFRKVKH